MRNPIREGMHSSIFPVSSAVEISSVYRFGVSAVHAFTSFIVSAKETDCELFLSSFIAFSPWATVCSAWSMSRYETEMERALTSSFCTFTSSLNTPFLNDESRGVCTSK